MAKSQHDLNSSYSTTDDEDDNTKLKINIVPPQFSSPQSSSSISPPISPQIDDRLKKITFWSDRICRKSIVPIYNSSKEHIFQALNSCDLQVQLKTKGFAVFYEELLPNEYIVPTVFHIENCQKSIYCVLNHHGCIIENTRPKSNLELFQKSNFKFEKYDKEQIFQYIFDNQFEPTKVLNDVNDVAYQFFIQQKWNPLHWDSNIKLCNQKYGLQQNIKLNHCIRSKGSYDPIKINICGSINSIYRNCKLKIENQQINFFDQVKRWFVVPCHKRMAFEDYLFTKKFKNSISEAYLNKNLYFIPEYWEQQQFDIQIFDQHANEHVVIAENCYNWSISLTPTIEKNYYIRCVNHIDNWYHHMQRQKYITIVHLFELNKGKNLDDVTLKKFFSSFTEAQTGWYRNHNHD